MLYTRFQLDERHPVIMRIGARHRRHIHIRIAPGEPWRRHADDGIKIVIKLDVLPDHIALSAELPLPEQGTQHGDWRGLAAGSIGYGELAPQRRRHAHVSKKIRRVLADAYRNRKLPTGQGLGPLVLHEQVVNRRCLAKFLRLCPIYEEQRSPATLVAQLDVHHPVRILIGIRIEQHSVNHAEDRSGGADPQSQREQSREREARRLSDLTKCVAKVLKKSAHFSTSFIPTRTAAPPWDRPSLPAAWGDKW